MSKNSTVGRNVPNSGFYRLTGTMLASPAFGLMGGFNYSGAENLPNRARPYILAPTHRSLLDIPALGLAALRATDREVHFLAKKEAFRLPLFGSFLKACGAFPVDRGDRGPRMKIPLAHTQQVLRSGGVAGIFPEGTTKKGLKVEREELFNGVSWLAMKEAVSIVPVGIAGTERGQIGPVHVAFGEPVDPTELKEALPYIKLSKQRGTIIMDYVAEGMQRALDIAHEQRAITAGQIAYNLPVIIDV